MLIDMSRQLEVDLCCRGIADEQHFPASFKDLKRLRSTMVNSFGVGSLAQETPLRLALKHRVRSPSMLVELAPLCKCAKSRSAHSLLERRK